MEASQNTLIISYDVTVGKEPLLAAIEQYNATILYEYNMVNAISIRIPDGEDIEDAVQFFESVDGVLIVNRDYIYQIDNPSTSM